MTDDKKILELDSWELFLKTQGPESFTIRVDSTDVYDWISKQSPDTWHVIAEGFNYDFDCGVLKWIVQQPKVDLGTVISLFCIGANSWLEYPDRSLVGDYNHDSWDTAKLAEQRLLDGNFETKFLETHNRSYIDSLKKWSENLLEKGKIPAFSMPAILSSFEPQRPAASDYACADGVIYWSPAKFLRETNYTLKN